MPFSGVEKKRKAKATAAEKVTQETRIREMKMIVLVGLWRKSGIDEEEESVLKERSAVDGFAWSSSPGGDGVGFIGVEMAGDSEPISALAIRNIRLEEEE